MTRKMNINGKKTWWKYAAVAAALLAVSACAKNKEHTGNGRTVEFTIDIGSTRAVETTMTSLDRIGVFGYSHPSDIWDGSHTPDYFLNKMVVRTSTAPRNWWYDGPTKYWPSQGYLAFFAYAPYVDVQDTFEVHPNRTDQAVAPRINYAPPVDAIDQIDLLWDAQTGLQYDQYNAGMVSFGMKHALTSITFQARIEDDDDHDDAPYTIEVLAAGIKNAVERGEFDLLEGEWSNVTATHASHLTAYELTQDEHKGLNRYVFHCQYDRPTMEGVYTDPFLEFVTLNKPYATLMILPQEFRERSDGSLPNYPTTVFITYRTTNLLTGETKVITHDIVLAEHDTAKLSEWTVGAAIVYQFTISLFDEVTVKVLKKIFVEDEKWVPGGETPIDVNKP